MSARRAEVRLDGVRVGLLEELEPPPGSRFTYDPDYVSRPDSPPLSLTLPVRAEPYVSRSLHPFFENLLPEGWLLELSTVTLKVAKDDAFGLVLATCGDCVGAAEIVPLVDVE